MKKKRESNIFDEASKKAGVKKKKAISEGQKKESLLSIESPARPAEAPARPNITAMADEDPALKEMLTRLQKMDEDLKNKINRICELSGMSQQQILSFMDNPQNFQPAQWSSAQRQKDALEQQIYSAIGAKAKKQVLKKKIEKMDKSRRGKTLGGRKGWIQM